MERICVKASRKYDIWVGSQLLGRIGSYVAELGAVKKVLVISDETVYALYGETVSTSILDCGFQTEFFCIKPGEASKCLAAYGRILNALCNAGLERNDLIVALGGGVVGDLAGFAAATYLRGIRYVQVPTTLLAAVDSSVGGKTAINLPEGKNLAGCFYQPAMVLCDTDTLSTLSETEIASGSAEVIKYAMLGDEQLMYQLAAQSVKPQDEEVICRCVAMKRDFVQKDEQDYGTRMLLNFGHTFGHAAEHCSHYTLPHGYGVAMGMMTVTEAAEEKGICAAETSKILKTVLQKHRLPTAIPYDRDQLLQAAGKDKKNAHGQLKLIVPQRIGACSIREIPEEMLGQWLPK